jgi:hypothetical protein
MSKKKRKNKKKKLTIEELKHKLESMDVNTMRGKRIGFEALQHFKPKVVDISERQKRKENKHKKDYKQIDGD